LTFIEGSGQIIPGLDADLLGLKIGDKKQFVVPPAQGYGMEDPKAFVKVPKKSFKNAATLKIGATVSGSQGGRRFKAVISAIGNKKITLDFNSPLAGKTLNFDVTIVNVTAAKS
jgi:FKBP-type peptidyl-prolyl cis-trans isomerase SlyD